MTSNTMTGLGGAGAALAVVQTQLPSDSPEWLRLLVGVAVAALNIYLGYTNKGTSGK